VAQLPYFALRSGAPITVEQVSGAGGAPNMPGNAAFGAGIVDQIAHVQFGETSTIGIQGAPIIPGNQTFGVTTPIDQTLHAPFGEPATVGIQGTPITPVYPIFGIIAEEPIHRALFGETIATDTLGSAGLHHDWLFG
jgi:hypothetical protein